MIIFKTAAATSEFLEAKKKAGRKIGFVPTMGALHRGHLSLIEFTKQAGELCICSIFVNPTQFNDKTDFEKYPSTIENDIDVLEKAGCDLVFLPGIQEIYPNGTESKTPYSLGFLETVLEGAFRPGHFQGVCQVVNRLLSVTLPHHLYLGQKDYQQCLVIKRLIELTHSAALPVICPTIREEDGLAMSSRNLRLNAPERKNAARIFETLSFIKRSVRSGYLEDLKTRGKQYLSAEGFKVDYVEIADAGTLEPQEYWDGKLPLVALVAAYLHEVRLIDNMFL
jgi:pantoate--beta-alanine ligase